MILLICATYALVTLAVMASAVFSLGTAMPEIRDKADQYGRSARTARHYQMNATRWYIRRAVASRILGGTSAGLIWPLSIPLWFVYRKGTFVGEALEKRATK